MELLVSHLLLELVQSEGWVRVWMLTSSVMMTSGYGSSDRKLKMHQILKASSFEMISRLRFRFFLEHSVQHILLKS